MEEVEAEVGAEAERSGVLRILVRTWAYTDVLVRREPWKVLSRGRTGPDFGFHRIALPATGRRGGQSRGTVGDRVEAGSPVRKAQQWSRWMTVGVPEVVRLGYVLKVENPHYLLFADRLREKAEPRKAPRFLPDLEDHSK